MPSASDLIVGAPVWDRGWCLDAWFDCVEANVDRSSTGLVFVVPAQDSQSREIIGRRAECFQWVEILRDKGEQYRRSERIGDQHRTLALARNQILQAVERAGPAWYLSWDTDFFVPRGTVDRLKDLAFPLATVWGWLNRQPPQRLRYESQQIEWQTPVAGTAMTWDPKYRDRAAHYPASDWHARASGIWRCDVALAFQLMRPSAYRVGSYRPHPDGEDIPFAASLEARGIPRYCFGDVVGVHLYDREACEAELGWPRLMKLASQRPLAADWVGARTPEYEALGFYPADPEESTT